MGPDIAGGEESSGEAGPTTRNATDRHTRAPFCVTCQGSLPASRPADAPPLPNAATPMPSRSTKSTEGFTPPLGMALALLLDEINGALFEERAPISAPGLATPPFAQFVREAGSGAFFRPICDFLFEIQVCSRLRRAARSRRRTLRVRWGHADPEKVRVEVARRSRSSRSQSSSPADGASSNSDPKPPSSCPLRKGPSINASCSLRERHRPSCVRRPDATSGSIDRIPRPGRNTPSAVCSIDPLPSPPASRRRGMHIGSPFAQTRSRSPRLRSTGSGTDFRRSASS